MTQRTMVVSHNKGREMKDLFIRHKWLVVGGSAGIFLCLMLGCFGVAGIGSVMVWKATQQGRLEKQVAEMIEKKEGKKITQVILVKKTDHEYEGTLTDEEGREGTVQVTLHFRPGAIQAKKEVLKRFVRGEFAPPGLTQDQVKAQFGIPDKTLGDQHDKVRDGQTGGWMIDQRNYAVWIYHERTYDPVNNVPDREQRVWFLDGKVTRTEINP